MAGVQKALRCGNESSKDRKRRVAVRTMILKGLQETTESYKFIKQINRSWKPKQSAIKDKNSKMLQGREEVKKWWTEYCSGLCTDSGHGDTAITDLDQISPSPSEDELREILYYHVETAVKGLKKGKSQCRN
jgi:hypothetical protein